MDCAPLMIVITLQPVHEDQKKLGLFSKLELSYCFEYELYLYLHLHR